MNDRPDSVDGASEPLASTMIGGVGAPPRERVGSVIGPYKLLQQLGEGGFGIVYMAEQEKPVRRMVAAQDHQAGHGYGPGHRPLRVGAAGPGPDGSPQYRPRARCRGDRFRPSLLRDGTGQRSADHRVLRQESPAARRPPQAVSSTSATRFSTRTTRGSSTATSSRPMCW